MRIRLRAALAALLSVTLAGEVAPGAPALAAHTSRTNAPAAARLHGIALHRTSVAAASPPTRVHVPEPPRVHPTLIPASQVRPHTVPGTRRSGVRVPGPPMLRPSEIDRVVKAAAAHRGSVMPLRTGPAVPVPVVTSGPRRLNLPGAPASPAPSASASASASGVRRAQSLPSDPTASGTGINPWWRYQETNVPGGGHVMVNVGTGNLLLQDEDMSVPHKGIAMAFRRTYNSQMPNTIAGDLATWTGMYGNGWTSTWDAHMIRTSRDHFSLYDIDGARYDYVAAVAGNRAAGYVSTTPGQHAVLTWDGACGFLWTKKSGTTYYFYDINPAQAGCAAGPIGGYAGRLYQIIGRNRNTSITFTYSWVGGDASTSGKVHQITATTESGMAATLTFADFSGMQLLQTLTYPDGVTSVQYGYDAYGNLTTVARPAPNNTPGASAVQSFGYAGTSAATSVIAWAASPRWTSANGDRSIVTGGYLAFGFTGTGASSTLSWLSHRGLMNFTPADGTNVPLQPSVPVGPGPFNTESYTTGVTTPTFRDTDGRMTNWIVDGLGRPTQTQECTASTGQGSACTGTWLVTNESWDANNNLVSTTDARGYETDYAYDANGNTIAVAQPQTTTSQGTFRPTSLYDYDQFNNVTAFCDPTETHAAGADWTIAPPVSDGLCSSHAVPHASFTFAYQSYEPNGELVQMTTPMGYHRSIAYSPAQQGGTDFGLPTSVTGDPFTQLDGTGITPTQTVWYDGAGNLRCYSKGVGTYVLSYDALGRLLSEADPDDSSANAGSLCGKTSGQPGWNTQNTYTYNPDGSKSSSQTPAERAAGVSTTYTYDLDGDVLTETTHHGCVPGAACTAGVTTKWYDGADRLVEVQKPQDPSDLYSYPWLTRYIYDLSQGSAASTLSSSTGSVSFAAYGNLFKTQEWLTAPNASAPSWVDLHGNAFDALDRATAKYTFSPSANTTISTATMRYDAAQNSLGLLSSQTDPVGETTAVTYNELGAQSAVTFSGDGGVTPAKSFIYDGNGRQTSASSTAYGTQTTAYDADGRVSEVDEPTVGSVTSPARITYDYYPNGDRKDLNVASSGLNAAPLMTYSRRADGVLATQSLQYGGTANTFRWTATEGGRKLTQTDPYTGTAMPRPQAPVNPGTLYAPTTWTYDTSGQMAGTGLPETLNYVLSHDDEGAVVSANSNVTGNSTWVGATAFWITTRGESFQQKRTPAPSGQGFRIHPANGALVPKPTLTATSSSSSRSSPIYDPINAVVLGSMLSSGETVDFTTTSCGPTPNIDTYDAASRLVTRNDPGACPDGSNFAETRSYDAENHTTAQLGSTAQWAPSGKPYQIATGPNADSLHYDGDSLLFVTDAQGALRDIKLGALADLQPNTPITVNDRDNAGMMVTWHNATSYAGVDFGTVRFGPWPALLRGGGAEPNGGTVPVAFNGSGSTPGACTINPCPSGYPYLYTRLEGFDWGSITVQGARVVDNDSAQWTTPDAYAGDVHDPASQKPFMWDNNNPYEYEDPSGFKWTTIDEKLQPIVDELRKKSPTFEKAYQAADKSAASFSMALVPMDKLLPVGENKTPPAESTYAENKDGTLASDTIRVGEGNTETWGVANEVFNAGSMATDFQAFKDSLKPDKGALGNKAERDGFAGAVKIMKEAKKL